MSCMHDQVAAAAAGTRTQQMMGGAGVWLVVSGRPEPCDWRGAEVNALGGEGWTEGDGGSSGLSAGHQ